MYVVYLLLLTIFIVGTYSSYAYFTVNKEKKNAIKMVTGNLTGSLLIDGEEANTLVVDGGSSKVFSVKLINKNEKKARFNLYYKGNYNNIEIGYSKGEGLNNPPNSTGVNLEANKTLGYFESYKIIVRNKSTSKVEIPLEYQVGLDYNDLTIPSDGHVIEEIKELTGVETLLVNYTNDEELQDYNNSNEIEKKNMYVFDHEKGVQQEGYSKGELRDYRYIGKDPNNYVTFNGEEAGWRIIGVFTVEDENGKKEQRIKLMRKDALIPNLVWDSSNIEIPDSPYGKNRWSDSQLQKLLNEGYDDETGGSLYWNRDKGICFGYDIVTATFIANRQIDCDFTNTGLLPEAKELIGKTKWYLGGISTVNLLSEKYYKEERGISVCDESKECTYFNPSFVRETSFLAKVGIMYASDYGYATSGGASTTKEKCLENNLASWRNDDISDCKNNDWIFNGNETWLLSPSDHGGSEDVRISSNGSVLYQASSAIKIVFPTVYLKSSVKYVSGDGSISSPFVFTK